MKIREFPSVIWRHFSAKWEVVGMFDTETVSPLNAEKTTIINHSRDKTLEAINQHTNQVYPGPIWNISIFLSANQSRSLLLLHWRCMGICYSSHTRVDMGRREIFYCEKWHLPNSKRRENDYIGIFLSMKKDFLLTTTRMRWQLRTYTVAGTVRLIPASVNTVIYGSGQSRLTQKSSISENQLDMCGIIPRQPKSLTAMVLHDWLCWVEAWGRWIWVTTAH